MSVLLLALDADGREAQGLPQVQAIFGTNRKEEKAMTEQELAILEAFFTRGQAAQAAVNKIIDDYHTKQPKAATKKPPRKARTA